MMMRHAKLEPCLSKLLVQSYEGEMSPEGYYHGNGVVKLKGGQCYEGEMRDGMMHGKGTYTWTDGTVYSGDFARNVIVGTGTYKWPDGSVYEGSVENGLRHGFGTLDVASDDGTTTSYRGDWAHGMRHGVGTMRYRDQSEYVGDFRRNKRCGKGKMSYNDGGVYEGSFVDDVKSGHGKMTWRDESYDGEWQNDKQNGVGTHIWKSHATAATTTTSSRGEKRPVSSIIQRQMYNRYRGEWRDGQRHGTGTFFYANGARYSGDWVHGIKHGRGVFIYENGAMYAGKFVNDRMMSSGDRDKNTQHLLHLYLGDIIPMPSAVTGGNTTTASTKNLDMISLQKAVMRLNSELKSVYQAYARDGEGVGDGIFTMTSRQFWTFCKDTKIIPTLMSRASVNAVLLATRRQHFLAVETARLQILDREEDPDEKMFVDQDMITGQRLETHSPARPILYREFVEAVVRLVFATSSPKSSATSLSSKFEEFMKTQVIPHAMGASSCSPETNRADGDGSSTAVRDDFSGRVERTCRDMASSFGTVTIVPVVLLATKLFGGERSEVASRVAQVYADMRGGAANDLHLLATLEVEMVELAEILVRVASFFAEVDLSVIEESRLLDCARAVSEQIETHSKGEDRPTLVPENNWRPYVEASTSTPAPSSDDSERSELE